MPLIIWLHLRLLELNFFCILILIFSVTRSMMNVIAFSKRTYTFIQVVKFSITVLGKVYVLVQGVLINLLFLKNPSFPLQLRLNQIFICSSWLFTACNVSFDLNKSLAVEYFLKHLEKVFDKDFQGDFTEVIIYNSACSKMRKLSCKDLPIRWYYSQGSWLFENSWVA